MAGSHEYFINHYHIDEVRIEHAPHSTAKFAYQGDLVKLTLPRNTFERLVSDTMVFQSYKEQEEVEAATRKDNLALSKAYDHYMTLLELIR